METYVIEWIEEFGGIGKVFSVHIEAESFEEACDKHRKIFQYPMAMNQAWDTPFSKADLHHLNFDVSNIDESLAGTRVKWEEYKKAEGEYFYLSALSQEETTERLERIRKDEAMESVASEFGF